MTSKQKQQHLEKLKAMIIAAGFKPDNYGNLKATCNGITYRIKLKKINIRAKRKTGSTWIRCFSKPITAITITELAKWLFTHQANNQSPKINNTPSLDKSTSNKPAPDKKYKWRLTWAERDDRQEVRLCADYLKKQFTLFRDSEAHIITYKEYLDLIAQGLIEPAVSYWNIDEGAIGLISLSSFQKYIDTWEKIHNAKVDFLAGFDCARKAFNHK